MTATGTRLALRCASTAALAAILVAMSDVAVHAQVVGINSAIRNQVVVRRGGTAPPRPAVLKDKVALRDAVQTAAASNLQILLLDGSAFTIGPNAGLTIDRFVYDPSRNLKSVGASVARGAFRFMSGGTASSGSTIRTPIATIGIRGTMVDGVVGAEAVRVAGREAAVGSAIGGDPDTASLIVLRGPGPNTQAGARPGAIDVEAGGKTVTLARPMLAVYVPKVGAAPIGPFTISAAGLKAVSNSIFPPSASTLVALGAATTSNAGGASSPGDASRGGDNGVPPATTAAGSLSVGRSLPRRSVAVGGGIAALIVAFVVATRSNDIAKPVSS